MKNLTKLLVSALLVFCYAFPQQKPEKDNSLIITPDGKILSRADGSIIPINYVPEKIKNQKLENDAPIGTPFSWDSNLNFYAGSGDWTVSAIAVSGSDVYIGGSFTEAMGDENSNYIVRYNQKTNTWHPLGTGLNGNVHAIAVSGNNVYVGGEFTEAGGNSNADHIARWDGSSWNALGVGLNDVVYAIAISGSDVYVGGNFIGAGGIFEADRIARWDGSTWNSMTQFNDAVYSIVIDGSRIFVGGAFTTGGLASYPYFAQFDGSTWGSLPTPLNGEVRAIAISGSDLYIGGAFTNAGGNPNADAVAYFDLNTYSGWQALGNGIIKYDYYPNSVVTSLAASGKDLYVGGPFWSPYNSYFNSIAYWNGITWDSLDTGLIGGCNAIALSGTDLLAGGYFGLERWFGAYAEGLYAGVQRSAASGSGLVEFNTPNDSTRITLNLIESGIGNGIFNVFCYEDKPVSGSILPVANHRWIIQPTGLVPTLSYNDQIKIKFSDFADSSGIIDPLYVQIYHRSTPGRGQFTQLYTQYDEIANELWAYFDSYGEFAIGVPNTINGVINPGEYGSHVQGENMLTSDGKTWYMRSDDYYLYFGISNYTNDQDAINIYLDNSGITPVNYPSSNYGTQIGTGNDNLSLKLPFGAEFYAYIKPSYDEYRQTNIAGGWLNAITNSFLKAYNNTGDVFEFAISLSSIPNQYNIPLYSFNWLGFLSNSGIISSRVPSNPNPSGILNDLVWYFGANINSYSFFYNNYTHIGPDLSLGNFQCYNFTYFSPGSSIVRTASRWDIKGELVMYDGTLSFLNNDTVSVGSILAQGGTINFSSGSSDAPLSVKYGLYHYGGNLNMNSGHSVTFLRPLYGGGAAFQSNAIFQNIIVNNSDKVYLLSDMTINESLTLLNGNIQTITYDTFYVILNIGAIIGGPGYVEGCLVRWVDLAPAPNGGDSPDNLVVNFPVGTANGPSPVSVDFSNVTTAGRLTVQAVQNVHPNTTNPSETLNRYWKITKDNNLAFTSANITFNYLPDDFNTAFFEATDEATMVVGKYDAANWLFPNISSRSPGGSNDGGTITVSGITSFSDFTIAKNPSALPVELSSFTAKSEENSIRLSWKTETEVDNYGFDVERRINEGEWNTITFIQGHGNSNSPKEYRYSDKELFAGGSKFQYRLKQIDNDGSFEYSDVVEVEVVPNKFELSQNYPNPFNPSTTIRFSLPQTTQLKINIYNMLGELVRTIAEGTYEKGYHRVVIYAANLPSGTYVYRLESSDFVQVKKMVLLK